MLRAAALGWLLTSAGTIAAQVPLAFVPNHGQWHESVRFGARLPGAIVWLGTDRVTIARGGRTAVVLRFEGADTACRVRGDGLALGAHNFFLGRDAGRWVGGVPGFESVRHAGLWRGVDLCVRTRDGVLEYDLELAADADLAAVEVHCAGVDELAIDASGALVMQCDDDRLWQPAPTTWEVTASGERRVLRCDYVLRSRHSYGFAVAGRDARRPLVIDPLVLWSALFGGSGKDEPRAVGIDGNGDVTIAGTTSSADLPATAGAFDRSYNGGSQQPQLFGDVFVARMRRDGGELVFATYLGGSGNEELAGAAVLPQGDVFLTGWTASSDFPTTPGSLSPTFRGCGSACTGFPGGDAFVTRLSPNGDALVWSTYLGGDDLDYAWAIAVDGSGVATVTGHTHSSDFPTTAGAHSRQRNGHGDAFVSRFDPRGALLFSTFFGGAAAEEWGRAVAVDAAGNTVIAGPTTAPDLPTTPGAFDRSFDGGTGTYWADDSFVASFDVRGALRFSSYLGSPGDDVVHGVVLDPTGAITVVGETNSALFPTTQGAFDTTHNGGFDAFVLRLDPTASRLLWSTFLGSRGEDRGNGIASTGDGGVLVTGFAGSGDFPVTDGALDQSYNGNVDAFVSRLDARGARLVHSTFVGGTSYDVGFGVAVAATGDVLVTGLTYAGDFPATRGAYVGAGDGFVVATDLLPAGTRRFGAATAGCAGLPVIGALSVPRVGNAGFALGCAHAPALGTGAVALSLGRLQAPLVVLGAALWVDPFAPTDVPSSAADAHGGAELGLAVPADPRLIGGSVHAQFLWLDGCAPGGISASNALTVTIWP